MGTDANNGHGSAANRDIAFCMRELSTKDGGRHLATLRSQITDSPSYAGGDVDEILREALGNAIKLGEKFGAAVIEGDIQDIALAVGLALTAMGYDGPQQHKERFQRRGPPGSPPRR